MAKLTKITKYRENKTPARTSITHIMHFDDNTDVTVLRVRSAGRIRLTATKTDLTTGSVRIHTFFGRA